jgi:hypothetical protein
MSNTETIPYQMKIIPSDIFDRYAYAFGMTSTMLLAIGDKLEQLERNENENLRKFYEDQLRDAIRDCSATAKQLQKEIDNGR